MKYCFCHSLSNLFIVREKQPSYLIYNHSEENYIISQWWLYFCYRENGVLNCFKTLRKFVKKKSNFEYFILF